MYVSREFDPGALLGASYLLPGGARVRLRMLATSDARELRALLALHGDDRDGLQAARLLRFDPRRRLVLCARALLDGSEALVGVGAIDLGAELPEPHLLVSDELAAPGVSDLLRGALVGRALALARTRAA